jgi:CDGSH-type Zn-finger protein
MESLSHTVRISIPNYLRALPIPETIGGFFKLSLKEWLALTPLGLLIAGSGWLTYRHLTYYQTPPPSTKEPEKPKVNLTLKKDSPKVVDTVDIEEIGEKKVFCRCWRSKKFPYCDGAHAKHNEETGDNVGPLIITGKKQN